MTVYSRQEKVDREGPLYDSLGSTILARTHPSYLCLYAIGQSWVT